MVSHEARGLILRQSKNILEVFIKYFKKWEIINILFLYGKLLFYFFIFIIILLLFSISIISNISSI